MPGGNATSAYGLWIATKQWGAGLPMPDETQHPALPTVPHNSLG